MLRVCMGRYCSVFGLTTLIQQRGIINNKNNKEKEIKKKNPVTFNFNNPSAFTDHTLAFYLLPHLSWKLPSARG